MINCRYDLEYEIDPLFQQTSAKFDEAGAKGLLLNNLSVIILLFIDRIQISDNLILALDSDLIQEKEQPDNEQVVRAFNVDLLKCI